MYHRPTADERWRRGDAGGAGGVSAQAGLAGVQSGLARAERGLERAAGRIKWAEILNETIVFQYVVSNFAGRMPLLWVLPNCGDVFAVCFAVTSKVGRCRKTAEHMVGFCQRQHWAQVGPLSKFSGKSVSQPVPDASKQKALARSRHF